ncbi:FAD-binding oxidoreductase [Delftia sp. S67]|jgi:D-arginine dehydrogenase|nr:FAD-binding oxidoreductase [Delftia sp. S65]MBK0116469.1 FAD-binding oxidoreductase [Delftia sp. S67]MBK0128598.1 FAD-binding oxidoreductase [Delftia sp. S66]WAT85826.1 FAD-dependent oxidoreductase [Delftia acidovorans]
MMESQVLDFAVIGGGMAGASVAWRLAGGGASVVVLEREPQPGYHATGRSAAMFMESYGTAQIRALTRASRGFYSAPPEGFCEHALLQPRSVLYIGTAGQEPQLDEALAMYRRDGLRAERIDARQACALVPCLQESLLVGAVHDLDAMDIDVAELHQGFLRGMARAGARLRCGAELSGAEREVDGDGQGLWTLVLQDGSQVRARAVVNAAGAWADAVARLCGARPLGIEPRRRSAFTFAAPEGEDIHGWPAVIGVDESFYFKPDAGQLLGSPANADPVPPHDVVAEELDVAMGIDRIETLTRLRIRRPRHVWAGLRSFAPDDDFVIGWDAQREGFFWLAGQGGYGIQTAAGASAAAAALLMREPLPAELLAQGVDALRLSPARFAA